MKISKLLLPLALGVLIILGFSAFDFKNFTAFNAHGEESFKVYALKLPSNLDFSGETVPLEPVLWISIGQHLLAIQHDALLKRANKYFPTIELILEEECSDDFKYLAVIEVPRKCSFKKKLLNSQELQKNMVWKSIQ